MKKPKLTMYFVVMVLLAFTSLGTMAQTPTYICSLRNDVQVSPTVYEFDVYIQRTGANVFKLAQFQMGINVNPAIKNGGTITVEPVDGSSTLTNPAQIPGIEKFSFNDLKNCIVVTPVAPPGSASASIIPNTPPGACYTRIRVINSVPFATAQPNLTWSFSIANGYQTKMFAYVGTINTDITVQASHTIVNLVNPTLNPPLPPTAFNVTGTNSYCQGTSGTPVGLDDSEFGVTYTLYKDLVAQPTTIDGNGSAISFGPQLAGTYTVSGTNTIGTTAMLGSAVITEIPATPVSVSIVATSTNVCSGTTVSYTATPVNGGAAPTYQWYVNGVTAGTNADNYSYEPANNDQVSVIMTSNLGGCLSGNPATSNVITMSVVASGPAGVSVAASSNPSCGSETVTFTATPTNGGTPSYQWYLNSTPVGLNQSTYSIIPATGDQVYVIMTSSLACATGSPVTSNTVTMTVDVPVPASVSYIVPTTSVCAGTPVTFTASATNGGATPTYQWYVNGTATGTNSNEFTYTPANNDQVYVMMTSSLSCTTGSPATSSTTTMTVYPLPTPTLAGPASMCVNTTGNVYSTEAGFNNYIWTISAGGTITAGGTLTDNTVTVTWSASGAQTVSVNYTDANSCTAASATVYNVTVNPLPVPTISGAASACHNSSQVYTTESGMTSYSWNVSAGGTITAGGGASDNTVTVSWGSTGAQTVSVNYVNANNCTAVLPTVYNVTVNALPVPTISGFATVCQGGTAIYSTEAGMTGYTWNVSAGGTITAGAGTNAITVTWNTAGAQTVSVNYTNANSCTAPSATVYNVTVNALPVPTITGPSPVCASSTGNVYTTEAGMSGYTWTVSAGGTITAGAGTNAITVTWNTAGAQTVSVNYTNGNSCTAASATIKNVTVNTLPVPTISGTTPAGVGTSHVYTTEAGMTSYVWTVSAGGTITAGGTLTDNTVTVLWNTAGAQSVSVNYNNANGCSALAATNYAVTVISIPPASGPVTGTSTVCQGTLGVAYSVAPIPNATGYVWTLPAGATIATGANTNSITVDFGYTAVSGNITVYGTNIYGNGAPSPAYAVTVNAAPVPTISGPASICSSTTGSVYSTQGGMTNYVWAVSAGGTITAGGTATDNTVTVSWTGSGAQTVSVSYTNGNGCTAAAPTVYNVSVGALPVPTITGDNSVCEDSDYYTYTTEPGMTNYVWAMSPGSGTMTWVTGSNEVSIFWTTPGAKFVSVSYTNASGCTAAAPTVFNVTVDPLPATAGTITGTTTLCQGTSGVTYTTSAISGATSYSWTVPTGATIVSGANTTSITVNYGSTAVSGLVTVAGSNGCGLGIASTLSVTVNPIPATPTITRVGYILTSSAPAGNQWYKDGELIPGATAQTYEVLETATYTVVVTLNGCSSESSEGLYVIYSVGMNEPVKLQKVEVYPNPNDGRFTLGVSSSKQEVFDIRILSNLGVMVYEKKGVEVDGNIKQDIDLSNLPKGVYSIILNAGNTQVIRKVVIN